MVPSSTSVLLQEPTRIMVRRNDLGITQEKLWEQLHFSFMYFNERQIRPEEDNTKLFCRTASTHISWKHGL